MGDIKIWFNKAKSVFGGVRGYVSDPPLDRRYTLCYNRNGKWRVSFSNPPMTMSHMSVLTDKEEA